MERLDSRLLDLNLFESIREFARWQGGALCIEEDGILLVSGRSDSPLGYANCAARVDPATSAELVLERARAFFGDQERGFTLWVRVPGDEDLERAALAQGLSQVTESPWMTLSAPLDERPLPAGTRLVRVKDEAGFADAAAVNREAYQSLAFSAEEVDAIFGRPGRALQPHIGVFVVYRGDEPISTATLLQSVGVGGIYWVGTRQAERNKGFGGASTRAAANAGFAAGAGIVALQATRMGESLYRRLGFRVVAAHRWLLATAARAVSGLAALGQLLGELPLLA
jgi:hypothetical protein